MAYAVRVLHSEREQFEKQQGWTIKQMTPVDKDEYNPDELEPSPIQQEYAPVIFAQDTVAHVISLDMLTGKVFIFQKDKDIAIKRKNKMFNLFFA